MDDDIWRPDYAGPPPISGTTAFDAVPSSGESQHHRLASRGRRRLVASASVLVVALLVGSIAFVWRGGTQRELAASIDVAARAIEPAPVLAETSRLEVRGDALDPLAGSDDPFPGADRRRLPTSVEQLWTLELARLAADGGGSAVTWVEAVDDRFIVVGTGDGRIPEGPAVLYVLDAATGEQQWSSQIETRVSNISVVFAGDDVLVLKINSAIVALDLATGSELWNERLAKVDGSLETIRRLEGTDVLAVTSPDPDEPTRLISATNGAAFRQVFGEIIGSDRQGRWYERRGDKIFEADLRDRDDGNGASFAEPELVAAVDSERNPFVAIIDGSLVTSIDDRLAVGPLTENGERAVGPGGRTPVSTELGTSELPATVGGVIPLGGSAFATFGGAEVTGAEVTDDGVRVAWQRSGVITTSSATERGVVLVLGTSGGSAQTLVDGATGETIAALTMSPGVFDALDVAGNGIVTRRASPDGPRIAALDLDGNEMWAVDGSVPLAIGDGIVVRSVPQPDGSFTVTAYGEPG